MKSIKNIINEYYLYINKKSIKFIKQNKNYKFVYKFKNLTILNIKSIL